MPPTPPQRPQRRQRTRRDVLRLGAGVLGAAFLLACTSDEDEEAPAATVTPVAGLSLLDEYRRPLGDPGGVLRLASIAGEGRDSAIEPLIYSTLVGFDRRTNLLYGDLAQSIELRDPLTVAFTLRPELRFHPNDRSLAVALTAEDVRREFALRAAGGDFVFSDVVSRIDAPDLQTVVLELRAPFALLFETFADARAAGIRSGQISPATGEPLGSGPFVSASREPAGDTLARNQLYHRPDQPLLDGVSVRELEDEAAVNAAFDDGTIDVLAVRPAGDDIAAFERPGTTVSARPGSGVLGIGLSLLPGRLGQSVRFVEEFQDPRVRRALSMAIDRAALAERFSGEISGPVGPAHEADALPASELAAHPLYQHDVAESRRLLSAAGAIGLSFRLHTPTDDRARALADVLLDQFAGAGLSPRLLVEEPAAWSQSFEAGDFEASIFDLTGLTTPDVGLRLHTSSGLAGGFSQWGYSNPPYDSAVRTALSQIDPSLRADRAREAQRLLLDDVPAMFPLVVPLERAALARDVVGYEFDAYGFNEGWLAPRWSVGGG
ncbi:MAG TPA: ABC transporter substrate-binding protein [Dehalococcoidia bacterium]|nr:ABC transporter substrate-binding protein [Dehalococcoidia bacterium]